MWCHPDSGPHWGNADIGIDNGHGMDKFISQFPCHYTDTLGRGNGTFAGARWFNVEDYEVLAAMRE